MNNLDNYSFGTLTFKNKPVKVLKFNDFVVFSYHKARIFKLFLKDQF